MSAPITLYVDYRSPFSYLVKDEAYALARDLGFEIAWRPYAIDLQGAYGGEVEDRTDRHWRKVRYLYMDARRLANRRGVTVRGPRKIYDPTLAHIGMLVAGDAGADVLRRYHDGVGERFWRREIDLEDATALRMQLVQAGAEPARFDEACASGDGERRCWAVYAEADAKGVFGVPTFVVERTGELFWGTDRVPLLRERMAEGNL